MTDLVTTRAQADAAGIDELRIRLQFRRAYVVPIMPAPFALPRRCYTNVDLAVSRHGGKRLDGWAVWQYEDFFLEAEPHAVWLPDPKGPVCITPQEEVAATEILFAPARSATAAVGHIVPQRVVLRCHPKVEAYLTATDAMNAVRHEYEVRGLTLEQMICQPRLMAALSASEEALSRLREE